MPKLTMPSTGLKQHDEARLLTAIMKYGIDELVQTIGEDIAAWVQDKDWDDHLDYTDLRSLAEDTIYAAVVAYASRQP